MKKDISREITVLNDALTILTNAAGMKDLESNWQGVTDFFDEKLKAHKGQPTEKFAISVYAAVCSHLSNLTVPEEGEEGKEVKNDQGNL